MGVRGDLISTFVASTRHSRTSRGETLKRNAQEVVLVIHPGIRRHVSGMPCVPADQVDPLLRLWRSGLTGTQLRITIRSHTWRH